MAHKGDEPPAYGAPQAPKPAYGGQPFPQHQQQYGYYQPQQNNYQPGPQMGYYNQQQPGPYPPQGQYGQPGPGQYYQPGPGYAPQQRQHRKPGLVEGLLAGIACCCCLDCLF